MVYNQCNTKCCTEADTGNYVLIWKEWHQRVELPFWQLKMRTPNGKTLGWFNDQTWLNPLLSEAPHTTTHVFPGWDELHFYFTLHWKAHLLGLLQGLHTHVWPLPFHLTWVNLLCSIKHGNRIPQKHRCLLLCTMPSPCSWTHRAMGDGRKSPASHESATVTGVC